MRRVSSKAGSGGQLPPLPRGAVRQPTPADYGGRPGKELWAILRRRYKVERALSRHLDTLAKDLQGDHHQQQHN